MQLAYQHFADPVAVNRRVSGSWVAEHMLAQVVAQLPGLLLGAACAACSRSSVDAS